METLYAKILVIVGLLFLTLLTALLPLFCLKLTTRHKRRSRKHCQDYNNRLFCCVSSGSKNTTGKNKTNFRYQNGGAKRASFEVRQIRIRKKFLISTLNCFAGGIFLGTSFIGLLPEIRKSFDKFNITWPDIAGSHGAALNGTTQHEDSENMPIAEIIVVLGLFFVLSIEQAAYSCNHWIHNKKHKPRAHNTFHMDFNRDHSVEEARPLPSLSHRTYSEDSTAKRNHDHSAIRSLMLVATLSIHSLLEGVAIGLEDKIGSMVVICIGVLFHKSLMAFSMGSNLVHSKQSGAKAIVAAFIFALASPIGIAIGIGIHFSGGNNDGADLVNGTLQAIATGTFLYITFFEVLVKEFESDGHRFSKVFSLVFGYGSVFLTFFFAHH